VSFVHIHRIVRHHQPTTPAARHTSPPASRFLRRVISTAAVLRAHSARKGRVRAGG
jgi:hypothetical protein